MQKTDNITQVLVSVVLTDIIIADTPNDIIKEE